MKNIKNIMKYLLLSFTICLSGSLLCELTDNEKQLFSAIKNNNLEEVKRLIQEEKVDVNVREKDGMTPLMCAAMEGYVGLVRYLKEEGADINMKDFSGWTALICAAKEGKSAVVECLGSWGVDINAQTNGGMTALMYAAYKGHLTVVRCLVTLGAGIDIRDDRRATALFHAILARKTEVVRYLIEMGAYIPVLSTLLDEVMDYLDDEESQKDCETLKKIIINKDKMAVLSSYGWCAIAIQKNRFKHMLWALYHTTIDPQILLNNLKHIKIRDDIAYHLINALNAKTRKEFSKKLTEDKGIEKLQLQKQLVLYEKHKNLVNFKDLFDFKFIYR